MNDLPRIPAAGGKPIGVLGVDYARNGSLLAIPFDPERHEVTGQSFTVLEGVLMSRNSGTANFDISATGDLVYVPGKAVGGARTLHWVDRNSGRAEQLPPTVEVLTDTWTSALDPEKPVPIRSESW